MLQLQTERLGKICLQVSNTSKAECFPHRKIHCLLQHRCLFVSLLCHIAPIVIKGGDGLPQSRWSLEGLTSPKPPPDFESLEVRKPKWQVVMKQGWKMSCSFAPGRYFVSTVTWAPWPCASLSKRLGSLAQFLSGSWLCKPAKWQTFHHPSPTKQESGEEPGSRGEDGVGEGLGGTAGLVSPLLYRSNQQVLVLLRGKDSAKL